MRTFFRILYHRKEKREGRIAFIQKMGYDKFTSGPGRLCRREAGACISPWQRNCGPGLWTRYSDRKKYWGREKVLRRMIESGNVPNLIFYGPSGTGKTTVANIIAERTHRKLFKN